MLRQIYEQLNKGVLLKKLKGTQRSEPEIQGVQIQGVGFLWKN